MTLLILKQGKKGEITQKREKPKKIRNAGEKGGGGVKKRGMGNLTACSSTLHTVKSIPQMLHAQPKWYFEAACSDYNL